MSQEKTILETIADNVFLQAAATAIAATAGTVSAGVLPVLTQAFAQGRAAARVRADLQDLNDQLEALGDKVKNLSDEQFRLVAGIVSTMLETIDEPKLRLLKVAAINATSTEHLDAFGAQLMSRLLRDISAAEVSFLARYITTRGVIFRPARSESGDDNQQTRTGVCSCRTQLARRYGCDRFVQSGPTSARRLPRACCLILEVTIRAYAHRLLELLREPA